MLRRATCKAIALVLGALAAAVLLGGPAWAQSADDVIRIAVVVDRTGPASALGEGEANTAELMQRVFDEQGGIGGVPVEITVIDSATSIRDTLDAVNQLFADNEIHALICCTLSSSSQAIVSPALAAGVPTISLAAATPIANPVAMRRWIFQAAQSADLMLGGIVADMQERGITDISLLALADEFGESGMVELQLALQDSGIELHRVVRYERDAESFVAPALAAMLDRPQAVVVWGIAEDSARMVRALRERQFGGDIYLSHGVGAPAFLEMVGDAAEGVRLPLGPVLLADQLAANSEVREVALAYRDAYAQAYGDDRVTTFGAHAHDALRAIEKAVEYAQETGTLDLSDLTATRVAIRDALENMGPFVGAGGVFDYDRTDHSGLDERAYVIAEVRGGSWQMAR